MRILVIAALVSACGAPAELDESGAEDAESDVSEAVVTEERTESEPSPEPATFECVSLEDDPVEPMASMPPAPECVYFAPDALTALPGLHDATHNALARWWRWYPEGGEDCAIRVILSDVPRIAQGWHTDTISGVRINPEGPIIDGDTCSGNRVLLIDVMTHELGHVFGFGHFGDGAMAETHEACEPVEPTDDEILVANGCGTWGPPDVADCPS